MDDLIMITLTATTHDGVEELQIFKNYLWDYELNNMINHKSSMNLYSIKSIFDKYMRTYHPHNLKNKISFDYKTYFNDSLLNIDVEENKDKATLTFAVHGSLVNKPERLLYEINNCFTDVTATDTYMFS